MEANLDQFKDRNFLVGVIERFEGTMAVIKLSDSQKIFWPIKNLPEDLKEGQDVRIILSTDESDEQQRDQISTTILNQILKSSDKKDD